MWAMVIASETTIPRQRTQIEIDTVQRMWSVPSDADEPLGRPLDECRRSHCP